MVSTRVRTTSITRSALISISGRNIRGILLDLESFVLPALHTGLIEIIVIGGSSIILVDVLTSTLNVALGIVVALLKSTFGVTFGWYWKSFSLIYESLILRMLFTAETCLNSVYVIFLFSIGRFIDGSRVHAVGWLANTEHGTS
jgi:hypothetical protein